MSSPRSHASDLFTHSSDRKELRAKDGRAFAEVIPLKQESAMRESKGESVAGIGSNTADDRKAPAKMVEVPSIGGPTLSFMQKI